MKLNVQHEFDCTAERFWEMYWSDSFDEILNENTDAQRELLEERDDGNSYYRKLRFTPSATLPRPVAKMVGGDKLVYEQENVWDRSAGVMTWKVLPTLLPGKLNAAGTFSITDNGDGTCTQTVRGDIDVKVRFIGGQIEKAVVQQVQSSYDKMAVACRQWLEDNE